MSRSRRLLRKLLMESFCRVAPSPIHGVGLFAVRFIPKGTLVVPYSGGSWVRFKKDDIALLPRNLIVQLEDYYYRNADGSMNVLATGTSECFLDFFFNESHNPNVEYSKQFHGYVAMRDIQCGEELLIRYEN